MGDDRKKVFPYDNAPVHRSFIAVAKINELKISQLGLFSSSNLKKQLAGGRFYNNEEVKSAVDEYFEEVDGFYQKKGIEDIEHRWEKCIVLKGDSVIKGRYFFKFSQISYFLCQVCDYPRSFDNVVVAQDIEMDGTSLIETCSITAFSFISSLNLFYSEISEILKYSQSMSIP